MTTALRIRLGLEAPAQPTTVEAPEPVEPPVTLAAARAARFHSFATTR